MSGGSQHNPNGRQSQLGPAWSPLQVASFLSRAPQAHLSSERGVTWHTPTPPPHLYHVPAPSPPDPLQAMAMKGGGVYRHTGTPPDIYRHTPTPPDKHMIRHTPSPGDIKTDLYPHLGPGRVSDKLRSEDVGSRSPALGGVDLSVSRGAASPSAPTAPALSVRDAPTINSLIARAQPRAGQGVGRVEALLERLAPVGAGAGGPQSVIVGPRSGPAGTPPPDEAPDQQAKRKRKPDRTVRLPAAPNPLPLPPQVPSPPAQSSVVRPLENGDAAHETTHDHDPPPHKSETAIADAKSPEAVPSPMPAQAPVAPERPPSPPVPPSDPPARRKSRSGSAETIDDIAAMIASSQRDPPPPPPAEPEPAVTIDKLERVLASPEREPTPPKEDKTTPPEEEKAPIKDEEKKLEEESEKVKESEKEVEIPSVVEAAAAPRRRSARTSTAEATNVPVESPSEAKPAELETPAPPAAAASFVEVENQLERMFAGIEEPRPKHPTKRRASAPHKPQTKKRRGSRASTGDRRRGPRGPRPKQRNHTAATTQQDHCDSASNASSTKSKGPYIQIKGPCASPVSVAVMNAAAGSGGAEEEESWRRRGEEWRARRGLHASTLGLRYDATTPDATWLCVFCHRGPHAPPALGDLFGPYHLETDCEEYRALDEATRRRYAGEGEEVWFHEACAVWAPGVVAAGARVWGLAGAVWAARALRCPHCARPAPPLACHARHCRARAHFPCAKTNNWTLQEEHFRAFCPRHA